MNEVKILEKLKEKEMSFQDLTEEFPNDVKKIVVGEIKDLLKSNKIIEYDKILYNVENLEIKKGFVHSNLNNMVWVENNDETNEFGIFLGNPSENLKMVLNKKDSYPGAECEYVEFGNDVKTAYILNSSYKQNKRLIVSKKNYTWHVINNGVYNRLNLNPELNKNFNDQYENGDILVIELKDKEIKITEHLGNIKNKGIETQIVKKLLNFKEKEWFVDDIIENFNFSKEKDLKHLSFITIDSPTTKDIDDAIAIQETKDGTVLFVAIANVDKYVKKDSNWDKEAKEAATTYYMQFGSVPMLDRKLTEEICSLNIGRAKSVLICEMVFDESGKQKTSKFYEAVIEVKHKVPYEDVDSIFNNEELLNSYTVNQNGDIIKVNFDNIPLNLRNQLIKLEILTEKLKKEQLEIDYWFLKTPSYKLNDNGKIEKLEFTEERDGYTISQKIVENCMLNANIAAANLLKSSMPKVGIFRNQLSKVINEKPVPANYDFDNIGHWGLQEETYTHFTSPIRRYCDLVVHRLIKSIINQEPSPYSEAEIKEITDILNDKSYLNKQINIKEKSILVQEYLEDLVKNKQFKTRFEMVNFNKLGCLFRNKQNIDVFIPMFKMNREIEDYLKNNLEDKDIQKHVDYINNYWQTKIYLDSYSWLDSKKETTIKLYLKEHKIEEELKENIDNENVKKLKI